MRTYLRDSTLVAAFASAMPPGKCRHFVSIAAERHRAPASAVRAGIVVEKKTASRARAEPQTGLFSLRNKFRRRPRDRGQEPIEAAFSRNILDPPGARSLDQFIVPLRHAQHLIDWFHGFARNSLLAG